MKITAAILASALCSVCIGCAHSQGRSDFTPPQYTPPDSSHAPPPVARPSPPPFPVLPDPPADLGTPADSRALVPEWVTDPTYAPTASSRDALALFDQASVESTDRLVALICNARPTPAAGAPPFRFEVRLGAKTAPRVDGFGHSNAYIVVPIVDLSQVKSLRIDLVSVPGGPTGLVDFLVQATTVVPLVITMGRAILGARWVGASTLTLKGPPPYRAQSRYLSIDCRGVTREALELFAVPPLQEAWDSLHRTAPRVVNLEAEDVAMEVPLHAGNIARAAALVGWADPRVQAVMRVAEAELQGYRERVGAAVLQELALRPPTMSTPIVDGRAALLEARVDCSPEGRRALRRADVPLSAAASGCALRLRVKNTGSAALDNESAYWDHWSVLTGDGSFIQGSFMYVLSPREFRGSTRSVFDWMIPPGREAELISYIPTKSSGVAPPRPWLLRIPPPFARWLPWSNVAVR